MAGGQPNEGARSAGERQRDVQGRVEHAEARSFEPKGRPMQAGARRYPAPPDSAPMYDAPYYKGSEKLLDKTALITGGDSGIGRAVAILFAREGADVAIAYLDADEDAEETERAVAKEGRRALLIKGDVADPHFAPAAVEHTIQTLGGLDVLVNNAAFQERVNDFAELTEAQFDRTLKTNLYGYFHMAKAAVPHMQLGGAIINTGAEAGIFGAGDLPDYAMTKGGVHAFTRSLAALLIDKGIRVNCVAPGQVWTSSNPADRAARAAARLGARTMMRRPAQPEEIAPAYVFFASPQTSSFITGEILPVIGGPTGAG